MGDDAINICGDYHMIMAAHGRELRVLAKHDMNIRPGDPVELVAYDGRRLPDASVVSIQSAGTILDEERAFLARQRMNESLRTASGGSLNKAYTIVLDREVEIARGGVICSTNRIGNGFVVKDCTFGYNRSRGILIKASHGQVSGNHLEGCRMSAILVAPEYWWLEAGSSSDLVITGNTITACYGKPIRIEAIAGDGKVAPAGAHKTISILANTIMRCPVPGIYVTSTDGLRVEDNTFPCPEPGDTSQSAPAGREPVETVNCTDVMMKNNLIPPPPSSSGLEEAKAGREARMAWWRQARFGMFLHWGPVSLTGLEISWSRANSNSKCPNKGPTPVGVYDHLYEKFNPVQFDAKEWVTTARAAGMKYMVLTAKHCDGFLLWHSQADDYNIAHTPFGRDVCGELAQAAHDEGMRLGWYFSPMDWRDPDFRTDRNGAFVGRMQKEVKELLGNYGRIDLLWFDWDGREPLYDQLNTYALVRQMQPSIIVNNRLDLGIGNDNTELRSPDADYYTPEQRIGRYDDQRPWETCMTLGTQWSWKPDDTIKSAQEVIAILARVIGGDGNLLLNVGPMPDGRIEPRQVEVLRQVGVWLRDNGESIYGTRGGPFKPTAALTSTRQGNVVYLHVLKASQESLTLPPLPRKIVKSELLTGVTVPVTQTDSGITVTVPQPEAQNPDTIIRLTLDGPAEEIPPVETARPAGVER
jgi:alpha-L-fucosidase